MRSLTTVITLDGKLDLEMHNYGDGYVHVNVWAGDSMLAIHCTVEHARVLANAFQELAAEGGQK